MPFETQQKAEGRGGIDPHQDGIARLEDRVEQADADAGEVVETIREPLERPLHKGACSEQHNFR